MINITRSTIYTKKLYSLSFRGLKSQINTFMKFKEANNETPVSMMQKCLSLVNSDGNDVFQWLNHYANKSTGAKIAVIKVGGAVLSDDLILSQLCESVIFLKQAGLFPIIVHGGGPQLNDRLEAIGIQSDYITGIRITTPEILEEAQKIFVQQNIKLVDAIEQHGSTARGISPAVFSAKPLGNEYGLVGEVTNVNLDMIGSSLKAGHIPVLYSLAMTPSGQAMNINADIAAKKVAIAVKADKVVYLNATGGLFDDKDNLIPIVNLPNDYHELLKKPWVKHGLLLKLNEIKELMDEMPDTTTVSVTSPSRILKELFTTKGDGTLFQWSEQGNPGVKQTGKRHFSTSSSSSSTRRESKYNVGLIGARGYVGGELIQLIAKHPNLDLVAASSRALVGKSVAEMASIDKNSFSNPDLKFENIDPTDASSMAREVDLWYLALPNGLSASFVEELNGKIIIDLSGDNRFNNDWTYGLPELNRKSICGASKISNPGCYATGAQVSLLPIIGNGIGQDLVKETPSVFGISGYSGAGTTPSDKNNISLLKDNLMPYALTGHLHEREITRHLKREVYFMPTVASYFRGIQLTTSVALKEKTDTETLYNIYKSYYEKEPLIKITKDFPQVANIANKHHIEVGLQVSDDGFHAVISTTIDNLLKGAATQAIQNTNLALGLDEYIGLEIK